MRTYISDEEKERIRQLTAEGKEQLEIAVALGWSGKPMPLRNRVYRWQKQLGLARNWRGPRIPLLSPLQEQQVFALSLNGMGVQSIAHELQLTVYQVRKFREDHFGRRRAPACRWSSLPKAVQDAIDLEILEHKNHAVDIAAKYAEHGVTDNVVLARAHVILECPKFLTGPSTPFVSNFPQRNPPRGGVST